MRKSIFTGLTVIGTVLALALSTAPVKAASAAQNQLHQLQSEINNATKTPQQWETAMHTISVQTGVPWAQLRALRQKYPTVEPSAVLIASVLADETKKAPEQFLKQAIAGQNWDQIARNNNVPLQKIDTRLERIRQALGNGAAVQPQAAIAPENQLHQLQIEVNNATKTTQQWETAMHTISVQTGVPRAQLSALRDKYPTVEPSAVLIAGVLADETKKAPEQFLKQAIAGQTWDQIARNNNVPLEKIDARLERIRQALVSGAAAQPGGKAAS